MEKRIVKAVLIYYFIQGKITLDGILTKQKKNVNYKEIQVSILCFARMY